MVYFLLGISFLIQLSLILAIIILYQRRSLERISLPTMQEDVETIYASIEAFVTELEKENAILYESFLKQLKNIEQNMNMKMNTIEQHIELLEQKQLTAEVEESQEDTVNNTAHEHGDELTNELVTEPAQHLTNEAVQSKNSVDEQEALYLKATELHQQGFKPDQIAKLLRIGNGEAQLLVRMMNKQEQ